MRIFVAKDLEIGSSLTAEFVLPYRGEPLMLQGVVRNRVSFTYGIEFTNVSEHDRELIAQSCRILKLLQ
jgi:hypothetical protein